MIRISRLAGGAAAAYVSLAAGAAAASVPSGAPSVPAAAADNAWVSAPSLSERGFVQGADVTLAVGKPLYGVAYANYTAEDLSRLPPGEYTLRTTVDGTARYAGLTNYVDFTVLAPGFDGSRTIICCGDSLTYGQASEYYRVGEMPNYFDGRLDGNPGTLRSYPWILSESLADSGYNVISQAKGGMTANEITIFMGRISTRTSRDLVLPADGATDFATNLCYNCPEQPDYDGWGLVCNREVTSEGRARRLAERGGFLAPLYPLREPSANNFYSITGWLGDEHVRIVCTNAATATVTRLGRRDGATVMPAGTAFVADAALMDPYRNATYVLFVGTNDGNGYADQYLRLYKAATDALPSGRFIVASSHQIADAAVIAKYRDAFGDHHLDMRKAMDDEGLATAVSLGLLTPEEAGGTTWRDALVAAYDADGDRDGVHFNEKGYAVVAEFIRRKLVSLGYVKIASEPPSDAFDWLETDGNGYVRTAYRPKTAKTRMEMRVRFLDEGRSHGLAIANPGTAGKTGEGVEWGCVRFGPDAGHEHSWYQYYTKDDEAGAVFGNAPSEAAALHTVMFGAGQTALDGVTNTIAKAAQDLTADGPLTLFAANWGRTTYSSQAKAKVYGVKVWEVDGGAETLVHDWIPATNATGAATLYDRVDGIYLEPTDGRGFRVGCDEPAAVAEVGGRSYATVGEAMAEARPGETVTLKAKPGEATIRMKSGVAVDVGAYGSGIAFASPAEWFTAPTAPATSGGTVYRLALNDKARPTIADAKGGAGFELADGKATVRIGGERPGLFYALVASPTLDRPAGEWEVVVPFGEGKVEFTTPAVAAGQFYRVRVSDVP